MKRLAICVTGGSGTIYGYRLLKALSVIRGVETHLVITNPGALVMKQELGIDKKEVEKLATKAYDTHNFMAPIASGSFKLDGVVIAPCSMKTLAAIAMGYEENLVIRVASVALKEKFKLILLPRETPLSTIHLRNMLTLAEAGAIIMPPMPPFYFNTKDIDKLVDLTIGRILTMLGIDNKLNREWGTE